LRPVVAPAARALARFVPRILRAAALAGAVAVSGCAIPTFLDTDSPAEFELEGRVGVQRGGDAFSAGLAWRHGRDTDEIFLTNSFGQVQARLLRSLGEFSLIAQDGREFRAHDAETLTERVLGVRLPVSGLAAWIQGLADPAAGPPEASERDATGRLAGFEQAGWRIRYEAWDEASNRPTRLELSYPGLRLRVIVQSWKLAANGATPAPRN
jgi:outer membrane lipoprotein LolB